MGGKLCIVCPFHRYKITLEKGTVRHDGHALLFTAQPSPFFPFPQARDCT